MICSNDDFDLKTLEWYREFLISITNLEGAFINLKSVDVLSSLSSTLGLDEDDCANATTDAIWSISKSDSLDRTHALAKVVLQRRVCISPSAAVYFIRDHARMWWKNPEKERKKAASLGKRTQVGRDKNSCGGSIKQVTDLSHRNVVTFRCLLSSITKNVSTRSKCANRKSTAVFTDWS